MITRILLVLVLALPLSSLTAADSAESSLVPVSAVGRRAPEFTWVNARGGVSPGRALGNLPMVLLVSDSANRRELVAQAKQLESRFRDFAGLRVVFAVALTAEDGRVASNIPFIYAANGPQTAANFGATAAPFQIFIVGRDGNIELAGNQVLTGQRVLDVIRNSRSLQLTQER